MRVAWSRRRAIVSVRRAPPPGESGTESETRVTIDETVVTAARRDGSYCNTFEMESMAKQSAGQVHHETAQLLEYLRCGVCTCMCVVECRAPGVSVYDSTLEVGTL